MSCCTVPAITFCGTGVHMAAAPTSSLCRAMGTWCYIDTMGLRRHPPVRLAGDPLPLWCRMMVTSSYTNGQPVGQVGTCLNRHGSPGHSGEYSPDRPST